jgi:GNAT superfamily N-acetyltransferase
MASVQIRPATPEDAEGITRVYLESAEHHARIDPERNHVPDRATIRERYRAGQQHPSSASGAVTLVAEAGGEILGFLDARIDRPLDPMYRAMTYCFIADIAVAEPHRSQGMGEQLMRAAEEWGRRNGADLVVLEYHTANPRAAEFYARLGYRPASMVAFKRL